MLTIHKYIFQLDNEITIMMPYNATVLKFDNQNEIPTLWALVDDTNSKVEYKFRMFGTGHEIPHSEHLRYVGTAQFYSGRLVWHLFAAK